MTGLTGILTQKSYIYVRPNKIGLSIPIYKLTYFVLKMIQNRNCNSPHRFEFRKMISLKSLIFNILRYLSSCITHITRKNAIRPIKVIIESNIAVESTH